MRDYVIKSVNLSPDEAKKVEELSKKGIKLRLLVRYGIEVAEQMEKLGQSYKSIKEEINEIHRKLGGLSQTINTILNFLPLFERLKGELQNIGENISKLNSETALASDKFKKYSGLYGEILEKTNKQLSNIIELSKWKEKEIIRQKIEELDRLRLAIIQKYNLSTFDEDVEKWGMELANLKKLLRDNDIDRTY